MPIDRNFLRATLRFRDRLDTLSFSPPVAFVYNPLLYAWSPFQKYIESYVRTPKKTAFLGMNPGPWGMAQTGIPFGDIHFVTGWLNIRGPVGVPARLHPRRPVRGFKIQRSEISGSRLWGLFRDRFQTPGAFFRQHTVINYCPLVFYTEEGKNLTPDKISPGDRRPLYHLCDQYLAESCRILQLHSLVAIGRFAESRARKALAGRNIQVGEILHPSPASPAANRGWAEAARRQLADQGIWTRAEPSPSSG